MNLRHVLATGLHNTFTSFPGGLWCRGRKIKGSVCNKAAEWMLKALLFPSFLCWGLGWSLFSWLAPFPFYGVTNLELWHNPNDPREAGFPDVRPSTLAPGPFLSISGRSPGLHSWKKTLLGLICCNREAKNQEMINQCDGQLFEKTSLCKHKEIKFFVGLKTDVWFHLLFGGCTPGSTTKKDPPVWREPG